MKENNEKFILLDVRENNEIDFANISPHGHISIGEIPNRYKELDENRKIIVMCHSGVRSANVCQYLEPLGYNVYNLIGGIDANDCKFKASPPPVPGPVTKGAPLNLTVAFAFL